MKIGKRVWMVASVFVLVAGCTGSEQPPPPATVTVTSPPSAATPPEPDPAAVAWMNGMCGAVFGYIDTNNERAKNGPDQQVLTKDVASKSLAEMAELTGKAAAELSALPASPSAEADKVKQHLLAKFTAARDIATEGKRKVDTGKGNSAIEAGSQAMSDSQNAVTDALNPLGQFNFDDKANDALKLAAATAEKCKPRA